MGSATGAAKTAATRIGVTLEEYLRRTAAEEKWCTACKVWHPRRAFGRDRSRADGLSATCVESRVTATSRPGISERRARRAQGEAWCSGCEAWLPASKVECRGKCRSCANAAYRTWYSTDGAMVRARVSARRRGLDVIPPWWREDRLADGCCWYGCGRVATTLDHVWPVHLGGESRPGNLVPACSTCNSQKKAGHPAPWVDRGYAAFPALWSELTALALEHGTDEWLERVDG